MANKLNFTQEELLNYKFTPNQKGYEPLEVDETLDKVISDYKEYEKRLVKANEEIAKHLEENNKLAKELKELEIEYAKLKKQFDAIPKEYLGQDNYQLLKKVNAYEKVLYRKGINLQKALSDPDNC